MHTDFLLHVYIYIQVHIRGCVYRYIMIYLSLCLQNPLASSCIASASVFCLAPAPACSWAASLPLSLSLLLAWRCVEADLYLFFSFGRSASSCRFAHPWTTCCRRVHVLPADPPFLPKRLGHNTWADQNVLPPLSCWYLYVYLLALHKSSTTSADKYKLCRVDLGVLPVVTAS